ncbi:hypothetical protein BJF83_07185 [Nocardiopsis sp. CNR-923]|uniref:hypothetical protein n=1 Tax=Nocardiopsis sp. CNR-923 TaxID=1904965 RepID=UPI00096283A4|nr:hypothetical protein [Nocardiopsis sp. CNR-923]OLT24253.1 hypothetical protein BJF83_07185 [Nocardiopsis sp. CNR-923]
MTDNGGGRDSGSRDEDSWFKPSENRYRSQSEYQDPLEDGTTGDTVFPDSGGYAGLSTSRPPMVEPYPEALGAPPPLSPSTPGAISYPGAGASAYEPLTRIPGEPEPRDEPNIPGIAASAEVPLPPEGPEGADRADAPWSAESTDTWAAEPWSPEAFADRGVGSYSDGSARDEAPRSVEPGSVGGDRSWSSEDSVDAGARSGGASWSSEADGDGWSSSLVGGSSGAVSDEFGSSDPFGSSEGTGWDAEHGAGDRPWAADPAEGSDKAAWSASVDVPSAGEPWASDAAEGGVGPRTGGEALWASDDDAPWSGSVGGDRSWSSEDSVDAGARSGGVGGASWSSEADGDGWSSSLVGGSSGAVSDEFGSSDPFGSSEGTGRDAEHGAGDRPWSPGADDDAPWSADGVEAPGEDRWASDASFDQAVEPRRGEEAWSSSGSAVSSGPLTPEPYGQSGDSAWDAESRGRDEFWASDRATGSERASWPTSDDVSSADEPWQPDAPLDQGVDARSGASGPGEESWPRASDDPPSPEPYAGSNGSGWDAGSAVRDEPWASDEVSGDARWEPDAALDGGAGLGSGGAAREGEPWSPSGSAVSSGPLTPEPYGSSGTSEWDTESRWRDEPWTPDAALERVDDTWSSTTPAADEPWTPGDDGPGARSARPSASGPDTWEDELGPRSDAPPSWDGRTDDLDTWAGAGGPATDRYDDELSPAPGGSGNTWAFSREDARLPESVREAERRRRESGPAEPEYRDWGADSGEQDADDPGARAGATQMFDALPYDGAEDAYAGQTYDSRYHDTGYDGDPDEIEDGYDYDDPDPGIPSDLGRAPETEPEPEPEYDDGFTPADYGMPVDRSKARRRRDPIASDFPGFDDRPPGGEAGDAYPGYDSIDFLADTERGALLTLWLGLASLLPGIGLVTAVLALLVTGPRAKRAIRGSGGASTGWASSPPAPPWPWSASWSR